MVFGGLAVSLPIPQFDSLKLTSGVPRAFGRKREPAVAMATKRNIRPLFHQGHSPPVYPETVRAGCQDLKSSKRVESNSPAGHIAVSDAGCRLGCFTSMGQPGKVAGSRTQSDWTKCPYQSASHDANSLSYSLNAGTQPVDALYVAHVHIKTRSAVEFGGSNK